jgi:type II restriction enzyme
MKNLKVYQQILGCESAEEVMDDFLSTIAPSNRTYSYFVDWDKVRKHTEKVKVELNILNSLMDCATVEEVEERLRDLLGPYPQIIRALPILIATRTKRQGLDVLTDLRDTKAVLNVRFDETVLTEPDALDDLMKFCRNTGIFALFAEEPVDDLLDYVYGVEVGMDTHAHKNRSGKLMEALVGPLVTHLCDELPDLECIPQCTPEKLKDRGYTPPDLGRKRTMDFAVCRQGQDSGHINIETNYFGVQGSKPGVIVEYIDRQELLARYGWGLILVSDGPGWRKMKSLLGEAVERLDYIINLDQVRRGMLRAALRQFQ